MSKDIQPKQNPLLGESETDPTSNLVAAIKETFPLVFQQPLVAAAEWSLKIYSDHVGVELMLEALERTSSQAFGFFLVTETLSLRDIDDIYCFVDNLVEDYDGNRRDDEVILEDLIFVIKDTNPDEVRAVSRFLSLDKDSMINEFIIPYYKVSKASHIWLEDRTEIAFSKGTKKAFGFEIANSLTVLDRFYELETSDFVSIFEYILEEQDRVLEAKKVAQEKNRRLNKVYDFDASTPIVFREDGLVEVELASVGGWGWRDRDQEGNLLCDGIRSIDSVKIVVSQEVFDLLTAQKPLEASEIPSLMEAFPEGETTTLRHYFNDGETIEVANEKIWETLLKESRHSAFFNSYGLKVLTADEIRDLIETWGAEDDGYIINGDFNDTDGICAVLAGYGFANLVLGLSSGEEIDKVWSEEDGVLDNAEGIYKSRSTTLTTLADLHKPSEGRIVEIKTVAGFDYTILRIVGKYCDLDGLSVRDKNNPCGCSNN